MLFTDYSYNPSCREWQALEFGLTGLDVGLGYVGDTTWGREHVRTTEELIKEFPGREAQIRAAVASETSRFEAACAAPEVVEPVPVDGYW